MGRPNTTKSSRKAKGSVASKPRTTTPRPRKKAGPSLYLSNAASAFVIGSILRHRRVQGYTDFPTTLTDHETGEKWSAKMKRDDSNILQVFRHMHPRQALSATSVIDNGRRNLANLLQRKASIEDALRSSENQRRDIEISITNSGQNPKGRFDEIDKTIQAHMDNLDAIKGEIVALEPRIVEAEDQLASCQQKVYEFSRDQMIAVAITLVGAGDAPI